MQFTPASGKICIFHNFLSRFFVKELTASMKVITEHQLAFSYIFVIFTVND